MNDYMASGHTSKANIPAAPMKNEMQELPVRQAIPQSMAQTPSIPSADIFQPARERPSYPPMQMQQSGMQTPATIMSSGRGTANSVLSGTDFTQGFLQTQIGRHVKVEFLIGTNMFVDREGDLVRVGTDYIIIQETETDDYLLCDLYSIKFIRFYY